MDNQKSKNAAKPELLAKLTPAQREVYDNWEKESLAFERLTQAWLNAVSYQDIRAAEEALDALDEALPKVCEHGVSVYGNCLECLEIEKIVYPQNFDANGERLPNTILMLIDGMNNALN